MAINTIDQYIAAEKQRITYFKSGTRTTISSMPFSMFELAGNPSGTLNSTATNGEIISDATAGCPTIQFSTGVGYLTKVEFSNSVASRFSLFDLIARYGGPTTGYPRNVNSGTLTGQPDISTRCPDLNGINFGNGIELWLECVSAFTGNFSIAVTYTNSLGVAGKTTGTVALGFAPTLGRMFNIPLAAGDTGIQKIETVIGSGSSAGFFNLLLMRPLWTGGRVPVAGSGDIHDILRTGMPIVYSNSGLYVIEYSDSTTLGTPELIFEIANA